MEERKLWVQRSESIGNYPHGLRLGDDFLCVLSNQQADAIEAALDPASDLPEGVVRYTDGRLLTTGEVATVLREQGWTMHFTDDGSTVGALAVAPNRIVEVRPPSTPRTERVAWGWAPGRRKPEGERIHIALPHGGEAAWDTSLVHAAGDQGLVVVSADPDGMVTVLAEDGAP